MTHEILVDALVATTGLGIVVWAASVIARRSSATLRHTLWRIALAGFWLVPVVLVTANVLDLDAYAVRVPILPTAQVTQSTEAVEPQGSGSLAMGVPSSVAAASRETLPQQAVTVGRIDVANWLLLLWMAGAAFGGACFVRNMYSVRRLLSQSSPADDPILTARVGHWAAKIGLEKMPALAESETVVVPTVAGWRAPVILLPSGFSLSDAGSDAIIVHELAHVHRGDVGTVWLARFTRTLWWWHPLVWLIAHKLRSSAEEACDNWAIALTERRKAYAGVLVHWAEVGASASNLACAYQGKALVRRVKRILTERRIPMLQLSGRMKAVLAVCGFCAVVAAGTLRVAPTQAESSAVTAQTELANTVTITGQVLTPDELFKTLGDYTLETDAAVQAGQEVLSQYPLDLQMAGDRQLAYNYALATIAVAYQLAEPQRRCQEALEVTGPYLAVFGRTPVDMGCAVDTLHLRCLLRTKPSAEQLLQAARTSAQRALGIPNLPNVGGVSLWATSEGGLINCIFDCYVRAGRPQEAMDWFQRVPLFHPDLVCNLNYWEKLTDSYLQQHQPEKAIQAAVLCVRTCEFDQMSLDWALTIFRDTLIRAGQSDKLGTCLGYLRAGEGDNPLGDVPSFDCTGGEFLQMLLNAGSDYHERVSVYLYANRVEEALEAAKAETTHADAAKGIRDIARCLKARDMHLVHANQFINWSRTGEGSDPLGVLKPTEIPGDLARALGPVRAYSWWEKLVEWGEVSPDEFPQWAAQHNLDRAAMVGLLDNMSIKWPMGPAYKPVCAAIWEQVGDDIDTYLSFPLQARMVMAVYLGVLGREEDVKRLLRTLPGTKQVGGHIPHYLVASQLYTERKSLATAIWAWQRASEQQGPEECVRIAWIIRRACTALDDAQVVRSEFIPWLEDKLGLVGADAAWGSALSSLLWAYSYVGEREKVAELGRYWLQQAQERGVPQEKLEAARRRLADILGTSGELD